MTKLEVLIEVTHEIRNILRPYLDDEELEVALRNTMGAILDVTIARSRIPKSKTDV